jgi:putative tryptophan/tyrosine transport system substrate-binding protein
MSRVRDGIWCHSIVVVSAEGDPRLPLVGDAVAFWNTTLSELRSGFRLGALTQIVGTISVDDLKPLRTPFLDPPESVRRIKGNIVVVLSDGEFISFTARQVTDDKMMVAIKDFRSFPLTLPNVARNLIAHELGHAIGLRSHNADPTTLMCGRPAPCRPDLFASDHTRYFPLTEADKASLRQMYPSNWRPLPLAAPAQQQGRLPVIGVLWGDLNERFPLTVFRQGLADAGFVIGENVAIEFRAANLELSRLPALAADLVKRQVDVIFAAGPIGPIRAAKSATTAIPIVFSYGGDPVKDGLVAGLARPGGNVTGVTDLTTEAAAKRVGLLHELVPSATKIGILTGPVPPSPDNGVVAGTRTLGLDLTVFQIRSDLDLERAFVTAVEHRIGALIVDNFIFSSATIIALAEHHKSPVMYFRVDSVPNGGLISYHATLSEGVRKAAARYVGSILKGAKPADLPVQPTKFELAVNLKTARALGLTIPETLLAIADEVIQ